MLNIRITYTREYDNVPIEGVLVERFTHTNEGYGQTKDIALIFYKDFVGKPTTYFEGDDGDLVTNPVLVSRPLFRYVDISNDRLKIYESEKSIYEAKNKVELMDKYTPFNCFVKEYYLEDNIYNFVNYNGIKI